MPRLKKHNASKNTLRLYDKVWDLAERLGNGSKTRGVEAAILHLEQSMSEGVCPICKKPFDECEYFQKLED